MEVANAMDVPISIYYVNQGEDDEYVFVLVKSKKEGSGETLRIGFQRGHAFYIKDLNAVCDVFGCEKCGQKFTRSNDLMVHSRNKCSPEPTIVCKGEKVERPETVSESVFFPQLAKGGFSYKGCRWIEKMSRQLGTHIHHALCGHGREVKVGEFRVHGYVEVEGEVVVFEFNGCKFHGHDCTIGSNDRELVDKTRVREEKMSGMGYKVVSVWECGADPLPYAKFEPKTIHYPYYCVFDFEVRLEKIEGCDGEKLERIARHVPTSVAIGINFAKPTYLVDSDPKILVERMFGVLEELRELAEKKVRR